MANYPDNSFDLAIVDPPYFSTPELRKHYGKPTGIAKHTKTGSHSIVKRNQFDISDWSQQIPSYKYFNELKRVSRHQIIFGINYFTFAGDIPGRIVWDKVNAGTNYSDAEIASCSIHDSTRLIRYMWNGMMQGKSIKEGHIQQGNKTLNEKRIHPTQKPVLLYQWLLEKYSQPGDHILDTHVGSGSIEIACHKMNRILTGCEIHEPTYDKCIERIKRETAQLSIFQ
jgi:site-specific DNA-methyltransferase (adenine-specific)